MVRHAPPARRRVNHVRVGRQTTAPSARPTRSHSTAVACARVLTACVRARHVLRTTTRDRAMVVCVSRSSTPGGDSQLWINADWFVFVLFSVPRQVLCLPDPRLRPGIDRKQAPVHSVHTGFIPIERTVRRRVPHWDGRLVARQFYLHSYFYPSFLFPLPLY